jgi:nitroimidazol reductase NimA-like FMN-containing flavoprotein (pyridoxamine 5'-phosphate oxidase superfamily)
MEQLSTRPMRRNDRETDEQDARQLLARGQYGVLSTVGADGVPYGVPINYVHHESEIYFHSAPEGRKLDNLGAMSSGANSGSQVSFCVVGATEVQPEMLTTNYESVIASGEVRELEGEEKRMALRWLVEKYAPDFRQQGEEHIANAEGRTRVFGIKVRHISGKRRS